jgi:diguanylate cyclase (GGDEF)-like protein
VPTVCWALLPGTGAVVIVALNLSTSDASAGAQAFLVWPVLYASYLLQPIGAALVTAIVSTGEILVVVEASATPVSDGVGLILTFTVMSLVIVRLRDRLDDSVNALAAQALRDPLTGLFNRRGLDERLPALLETADRAPVSLLAFDLDNLKDTNDRAGHAAGDRALCRLAAVLRGSVRDGDLVFRLGGDEFCIVLPDCTVDAALVRAAEVRSLLRDAEDEVLTVSVGIATAPHHGSTAELLLANADRALYEAKHRGRDQAALCSTA